MSPKGSSKSSVFLLGSLSRRLLSVTRILRLRVFAMLITMMLTIPVQYPSFLP